MKIKSFLFALSALLFSCVAFAQDSTKMTTTHHHTTMRHGKKGTMTKGTTHSMSKTKKMADTNMSDSAK